VSAPAPVAAEAAILLVDDRVENLFALEAILEPLGYPMVRATSGEEALRELLRRDFAVILLDVQMPGLNGFETAKLIKARERSRHTPIIFLTAISSEEAYVFEGYSVGAVDYLAKPFQPDILRSKVGVFVDLFLKTQRLTQQEQLLHESERRELELRHRAELAESEARSAKIVREAMEELRELNEELSARQRELEHAMNARSRFYASMSHELRTPINAIIGYNSLLLENIYGPLNERQINGIERSHKAANHLLELVNDVLDLSKIEAGKIELQLEPMSIPALIEDLFNTVRPLADEHGIALTLERVGTPSRVISDPRRVRQILLNLLSNAIKFGEGHPVDVTCEALEGGGVRVEVSDHGTGISAEDLEKIFDEFVQLDAGGQPQGTGLGLAISRRLAELLNGSLEVESRPGEGSTFRLTLPPSADEALPSPGEPSTNGNGASSREPAPW
jgi:signal transduction histidine kinase